MKTRSFIFFLSVILKCSLFFLGDYQFLSHSIARATE